MPTKANKGRDGIENEISGDEDCKHRNKIAGACINCQTRPQGTQTQNNQQSEQENQEGTAWQPQHVSAKGCKNPRER